jgi:hypothetical protein
MTAESVQWSGYGLDDRGSIPGKGGKGFLPFRHCIQTFSGDHPVSDQWILVYFSQGVKRQGRHI